MDINYLNNFPRFHADESAREKEIEVITEKLKKAVIRLDSVGVKLYSDMLNTCQQSLAKVRQQRYEDFIDNL